MASRDDIEAAVRIAAADAMEKRGLELVDAEYLREPTGAVLRLTIDRLGGVSLDDCREASHAIESVLETSGFEALVPGPYNLEVSSPGLFRTLKRMRDFERAVGCRIKVRTLRQVDERRVFVGVLERLASDHLFLNEGAARVEIEMSNVSKANLEPELKF